METYSIFTDNSKSYHECILHWWGKGSYIFSEGVWKAGQNGDCQHRNN